MPSEKSSASGRKNPLEGVAAHSFVQTGLPLAHYFHTHKRRMQYRQFCEEGYPIGPGIVKSAIKQFKTRLTGLGMHWSRPAAEQMLVFAPLSLTFPSMPFGMPPSP
jgi:hypothetical protein